MNLLFDPNIAYLLLVVGAVLLLLAIVTPGTGLLEVGALTLLVLAGYGAYHIGFNAWALIVLIVALVPFVYAIQKSKREWALAVSILLLIAGSLYLFPGEGFAPAVNPVLASLVSLGVAGFLWLVIHKIGAAFRARPVQDLDGLKGRVGEAKTRIHEEGSVQVASELWSARSENPIPEGSRVRVVGREGFTLVVERDNQPE